MVVRPYEDRDWQIKQFHSQLTIFFNLFFLQTLPPHCIQTIHKMGLWSLRQEGQKSDTFMCSIGNSRCFSIRRILWFPIPRVNIVLQTIRWQFQWFSVLLSKKAVDVLMRYCYAREKLRAVSCIQGPERTEYARCTFIFGNFHVIPN